MTYVGGAAVISNNPCHGWWGKRVVNISSIYVKKWSNNIDLLGLKTIILVIT